MIFNSPMEVTEYFLRTHMEQRNLADALKCLTDNVEWFGTGAFEIVHCKADAQKLLEEEISFFPDGYSIKLANSAETKLNDGCGIVHCIVEVTDRLMKSTLECRLTTACVKINSSYLIASLHMSLPTELQKGREYYPLTIAEQKMQLEFANAEMQTIIGNIPGGVHRCRLFDRICVDYVSSGFEQMSGYTQAEIETMFNGNYAKLLVLEDRETFAAAIRQLAAEPDERFLEYRMVRKDGSIILISDHFRSVRMEDGKMWGFGVAMDITTQHEASEQLKLITDSIPGGIAVCEFCNHSIKMLYFSDGVCNMLGYSREEYAQMTQNGFKNLILKEDKPAMLQSLEKIIHGGKEIDCVYRVRAKNDAYIWINLRGTVTDRLEDTIRVSAVLLDITDAREANERLRIRDEEYALAIRQSGKIVYRYVVAAKTLYLLQKPDDEYRYPQVLTNAVSSVINSGFICPESIADFKSFYAVIHSGEKSGTATVKYRRKGSDFGWNCLQFTSLFNSVGEVISAVITIYDITKQREQELAYERLTKHVDTLSKDATFYFEANLTKNKIERTGGEYISDIKQNVFDNPGQLLESTIEELIFEDDKKLARNFFSREVLNTDFATGKTEKEAEIRIIHNNNLEWSSVTAEMICDPYTQDILVYVLFRNIDTEKKKEINIIKQAETDGLTGLYNRAATEHKIKMALQNNNSELCALAIVDADDLKKINDTFGHLQGDRAIINVGTTLQTYFGKNAHVGRIGGDEFLIFVPNVSDKISLCEEIHRLMNKLSNLSAGEHNEHQMHASIGIALGEAGKTTFTELYKQADTALYYVKRHGKNSFAFFEEEM